MISNKDEEYSSDGTCFQVPATVSILRPETLQHLSTYTIWLPYFSSSISYCCCAINFRFARQGLMTMEGKHTRAKGQGEKRPYEGMNITGVIGLTKSQEELLKESLYYGD